MTSSTHRDTKNVKLGPCKVTFDGTDLGFTSGGVEVEVSTETQNLTVDQFGNTSVDERIMGRSVTATVPLAETTLENLINIMPGAVLTEDSTDSSKRRVDVPVNAGASLLDLAKELILHPEELPESDVSEDFTMPRAMTPGSVSFAYNFDNQRVYNVQFTAYPDPNNDDFTLFIVGDTDVSVS